VRVTWKASALSRVTFTPFTFARKGSSASASRKAARGAGVEGRVMVLLVLPQVRWMVRQVWFSAVLTADRVTMPVAFVLMVTVGRESLLPKVADACRVSHAAARWQQYRHAAG
jgi:hypothetical protein